MRERVSEFVRGLDRTRPPVDLGVLQKLAEKSAVRLPSDYLEFMSQTNGGDGDFGSIWIEFWPVASIVEVATVYGFDVAADGEIVEGDWIGLRQDQLIRHGTDFTRFLDTLMLD